MLKSLLLKDLRLLSRYLILGAILTILAYGVGIVSVWLLPDDQYRSPITRTAMVLSGGSVMTLWFATFGCALVAGNAFAAERMDQSALFLDYLPPTRKQVLLSKLLIVVGFACILFLMSLTASAAAWSLRSYGSIPSQAIIRMAVVVNLCKVLTCITGISFAASAIAKSNGAPILLGLLSPLFILSAVKLVDFLLDLPVNGETLLLRFSNACCVIGVASMAMGCRWYVSQRYES